MLRISASIVGIGLIATSSLLAADAWQSKPYMEWSDKDVQKLLTNSPWARMVPFSVSGRGGGSGGPRSGRNTSSTMGEVSSAGGGESIGGGPGAPNRRGDNSGDSGLPGSATSQTINLLVVWQSSMPIKQANLRAKYSAEQATSAEAKKFLGQEEPYYVIKVTNPLFAAGGIGRPDDAKEAIKTSATLRRKGKDPIYPEKVEIMLNRGPGADIYLMFPKKDPIVEDDKDVEVSYRHSMGEVKQRFKLKDMMFDGKLAL